jgi:threonine/homoserine/homoserine lactone efflux protein
VIARMFLLIAAGLAFVLLAGLPARFLWGDQALVYCGTAVLLCLLPGVLTMLWIGSTTRHDPHQASLKLLAASGLRMFGVLSVAVLLYFQAPWFQGEDSFLFWVLGAYLVLLAVEVLLTVRSPKPKPSEANDPQG